MTASCKFTSYKTFTLCKTWKEEKKSQDREVTEGCGQTEMTLDEQKWRFRRSRMGLRRTREMVAVSGVRFCRASSGVFFPFSSCFLGPFKGLRPSFSLFWSVLLSTNLGIGLVSVAGNGKEKMPV